MENRQQELNNLANQTLIKWFYSEFDSFYSIKSLKFDHKDIQFGPYDIVIIVISSPVSFERGLLSEIYL